MLLADKTRKYLNQFTEPNRKSNGDVPVKHLKDALKQALAGKFSEKFILTLCSDIRLEMAANNEIDTFFFQLISECEDAVDLTNPNDKKKMLSKLHRYFSNTTN